MPRALLVVLFAVAVLAVLGYWVLSPPEEPAPVELPAELDFPALYRGEARGEMTWTDPVAGEEASVPGRARADYIVYPDDRVVMTHLTAWMDDVDLTVEFGWWESETERLRCTRFSNARPFRGSLSGSEIEFPAGFRILGHSFYARGADDSCSGAARELDLETDRAVRVLHDPAGNRFGLDLEVDMELENELGDNPIVTLTLETDGAYLDRPPVAVLATASAEEEPAQFSEGCPGTRKGKPPIALANSSGGLHLQLRSESYDPDGFAPQEIGIRRARQDISQERWLYSDGGRFRYLGDGREMGPMLFETGREHRLLLIVVDRQGSQDRVFCHFQVEEPE